ncbi:MAG: hypothetical protein NTX88_05095 [Candidatus Atribacteria bacterium]|nr:hypothetical protein [Candidatus Atribacteria bacterium]
MFLDVWFRWIEMNAGWPVFLIALLLTGIIIGFFFQRWRRFFFALSTLWVILVTAQLFLSSSSPGNWSRKLLEHWNWNIQSLTFWIILLGAVVLAVIMLSWKKSDPAGRFLAGIAVIMNGYYLLIMLTEWVELLRFTRNLPFVALLVLSLGGGFFSLATKRALRVISSLLGSVFLTISCCEVLKRLGESDTFLGQSPFLLFLFLVVAVLMDAVQSRS